MDALSDLGHFGKTCLRQLNYCRLYLQVRYISELTTAWGTHLIDEFWTGPRTHRRSDPLFQYPYQETPSSKYWSQWKSAIRSTFCHPYSITLRHPLLAWLTTRHRRYHSITLNPYCLWHHSSTCHTLLRANRRHLRFTSTSTGSILSQPSIPIDIFDSDHNSILTTLPASLSLPVPPPVYPNLQDHLQHLLPWQRPLLNMSTTNVLLLI